MAVAKDWTDDLAHPCATRYFAGGDDTSWCQHTFPGSYVVVTVRNRGTEVLYVSVGPALMGTAAATQNCVRLQANEAQTFVVGGRGAERRSTGKLSTWATDGSTHAMDLTFESIS